MSNRLFIVIPSWIPDVPGLTAIDFLIYGVVNGFNANGQRCFAGNDFLSRRAACSIKAASNSVKKLASDDYKLLEVTYEKEVRVKVQTNEGIKEMIQGRGKRTISPSSTSLARDVMDESSISSDELMEESSISDGREFHHDGREFHHDGREFHHDGREFHIKKKLINKFKNELKREREATPPPLALGRFESDDSKKLVESWADKQQKRRRSFGQAELDSLLYQATSMKLTTEQFCTCVAAAVSNDWKSIRLSPDVYDTAQQRGLQGQKTGNHGIEQDREKLYAEAMARAKINDARRAAESAGQQQKGW